jgi:hypothetical protein
MPSFAKMRRRIEQELNQRFSQIGFPKTKAGGYIKSNEHGYRGVSFNINDYGDVATRMNLLLRFDQVERSLDLCEVQLDWVDPRALATILETRPTFTCSYEQLVGIPDWTFETISSEAEIPALCDLWLDRFQQVGPPYFGKYGDLQIIAKMVRSDDPHLVYLCAEEGMRYLTGACVIHAVDGHEALVEYVRQHDRKFIGMFRDMVDRLVAASWKQQGVKR